MIEQQTPRANGDRTKRSADALWYVAPGQAELRREALPSPQPGEVVICAQYSAISRGTESLIFGGRIPVSEYGRMAAPFQQGTMPFPVKYGYSMVGLTPEGRPVFCLHPHQDVFILPDTAAIPVPTNVPPRRAVLAANMETALNAIWDSGAGPADRIAVIGGGVVGLLTAYLAALLPGAAVTLVEIEPSRAEQAAALGFAFAAPSAAPDGCDVVFHASASAAGLATALHAAGDEATVVELSWYGDATIGVGLGGPFHARRLTLRSSQVGQVAPSRRPRWSYRRRLEAALALLADDRLDVLLEPDISLRDLPSRLPEILGDVARRLCQIVRYP